MDSEQIYMVFLAFETFFNILKCCEAFSWVLRSSKGFSKLFELFFDVREFSEAFRCVLMVLTGTWMSETFSDVLGCAQEI